MDRYDVMAGLIVIGICAALLTGIVGLGNWLADTQCYARWTDNFAPRYDWASGCTIEVDGHRIPSANYRVL